MLPKWHILIGFIISYILVYFFNFPLLAGLIIFLTSWLLIDLDHPVYYSIKTKNFNPKKCMAWWSTQRKNWLAMSYAEKSRAKANLFIFHSLEFWIILIILSFFFHFFAWILIGVGVHMAADYVDIALNRGVFYHKVSLTYTLISNKNKNK